MSDWNFADVWDEIARLQPDLPAVIRGEATLTWSQLETRADSLARRMLAAGLGHQAKVAQYLHNSAEYIEALYACFKASMVPVNTNYRYVDAELVSLWRDADVEAVVFHASFTAQAGAARAELPGVRRWLWVDDGQGPCPPWAEPYEDVPSASTTSTSTAASSTTVGAPATGPEGRSGDDLFLLYTGGTTGRPKGVMWRQDDLFAVLNRTATVRYPEEGDADDVPSVLPSADQPRTRVLPAAPLMHGTAAFSAFGTLGAGGAVVLTEGVRFDPVELLDTLAQHRVTEVSIVGDAFAQPLLAQLDAHPGRWDLSSLRVMLSSGVMWSQPVKEGLLRHIPDLLCVDTLGSSEAVGVARSISSKRKAATTGGFKLGPDAQVITEDGTPVEPGSGESGLVAVAGRGPVGYYKDAEASARTFRVIGARRWITPGDHALVHADGTVALLGRGSSCINTGGEKVFPEEVEEALKLLDGVHDAVVVGVPDPRFGEMVVAVVEPTAGATPREEDVKAALEGRLASYKQPRRVLVVDDIGRAPNGKLDQRRWRDEAARATDIST